MHSSSGAATVRTAPVRRPRRIHAVAQRLRFTHGLWDTAGVSAGVFFLSFVRWFGMPSPFAPALMLAAEEHSSVFSLLGLLASFVLRLVWGLEADVWLYVGCLALWLIRLKVKPRHDVEVAALGGLALMPRAVAAAMAGAPLPILLSCAAVPLGMLSAAFLRRGLEAMRQSGVPMRPSERACAAFLLALMVAGLGNFGLAGVNLGHVVAVLFALLLAVVQGGAAGALGGLLCGLALAFGGHDSRITLCLALGGLLCGLSLIRRWRWLCVPMMLLSNLLAYCATGLFTPPLSYIAAGVGALFCALMPERHVERLRAMLSPERMGARGMESAFVMQRIGHIQDALEAVAAALPTLEAPAEGAELSTLLCSACPDRAKCERTRMSSERALCELMAHYDGSKAANEAAIALMTKRGCTRAEALPALAHEALIARRKRMARRTRAQYERDLTLTHLAAMSGTLNELGALAAGESLSDLQAAHQITQAVDALNLPARLTYARRVDGRLQAALQQEGVLPLQQKQLDALLHHLEAEAGFTLSITAAQKGRIELEEVPLYTAMAGTATLCAGEGDHVNGDCCMARRCEGGRMLLILCDGMGHGEAAHRQSEKAMELLGLLLSAGYTRRQAITAVNGIMLSAQEDERFSTVDLADVDLWSGDVYSEKLGACASWVVRGNHLKKLEGSSLPLGIVEEARPTGTQFRLHSGDILVMMTDGVSEAFETDERLSDALLDSVFIEPQRMADTLLRAALIASGGTPRDDMTVMVMLLLDRNRGG